MDYIIKNAKIYFKKKFYSSYVFVSNGSITNITQSEPSCLDCEVFDFNNCILIPGLIDVHVHLREPGFFYKETIETGTLAAAHGGYTDICSMPNLSPAMDSAENMQKQLDIIKSSAVINVHPYATITKQQKRDVLCDFESLKDSAVAFSDDGRGVQDENVMLSAMLKAKELNKIIAAHCEQNELLNGGYIHDGVYAKLHGHKTISSASEYEQVKRDIALCEKTGCSYHVCHISTKESVDMIRMAKKKGIDITCETAPHYLVLCDDDIKEDGKYKMNPPLRSKEDRKALIEGICDGTIDMIATDHAPHSIEEKSLGLEKSLMGVVGLESAFAIMYTHFVKTGIISLEKLITLMHDNPKDRFKIGNDLEIGSPASFSVFNLNDKYKIDPNTFLSKGKSTPFEGYEVFGVCEMTMINGRIIWKRNSIEK